MSNNLHVFIGAFLIDFIFSLIIYKLLGFEVGLFFVICFSTAIITSGFSGVENTIIALSEKTEGALEEKEEEV